MSRLSQFYVFCLEDEITPDFKLRLTDLDLTNKKLWKARWEFRKEFKLSKKKYYENKLRGH